MPVKTLMEIREMAQSASKIPVATRIGKLRAESDEYRKNRAIATQAREKTRFYKNKIMKL